MSFHNDQHKPGRILSFRAPDNLLAAITTAASKDFSSASDVVRRAVAKEMRDRGLLREPVHAA